MMKDARKRGRERRKTRMLHAETDRSRGSPRFDDVMANLDGSRAESQTGGEGRDGDGEPGKSVGRSG